jgi:hypothetical protein
MSGFTACLAAAMPARSVSDETRVSAGGSNMRRRVRACLANALLVAVSVLLTYAIAEVVFFRVALPYLSLSTLPHIPDRAAFFLQGSKREYVPHDYIALVGDSNAQGMGDC